MGRIFLDKENKTIAVQFNTKFYSPESIMRSAQVFTESCWVLVDGDKEGTIQVNLTPRSGDINLETIGYEFYNYVLGIIKNE